MLTEAQKKVADFATRPKASIEKWRAVRAAEEAAAEERMRAAAKAGQVMPDGTVCAGISPDTNRQMFTTPEDEPHMSWYEAHAAAARKDAHGHKDWRVATPGELRAMFNHRAAIGKFDLTGDEVGGWYWTAVEKNAEFAHDMRFRDGQSGADYKAYPESSVRFVRG